MNDSIGSLTVDAGEQARPREPNFRAVIDAEKCKASGTCIAACEENAIYEGPKRLPTTISCMTVELLPGKSEVHQDKCTGCGECVTVCPVSAITLVPA
jgi:NAD-dependent dihydropyrimidine dehydrogenase PreA subunit